MKLLLVFFLLLIVFSSSAQTADYISIHKKNGRVVKNFYTSSDILLQTTEGNFLQGPIKAIKNDSVFVTIYDTRFFMTQWGTRKTDTISASVASVYYKDIARIHLSLHKSFWERNTGTLLEIGGIGYFTLNLLNGTFFSSSVTSDEKLRTIGIAAGAFGLGFLFNKLFRSDGFTTKKHVIEYINLSSHQQL